MADALPTYFHSMDVVAISGIIGLGKGLSRENLDIAILMPETSMERSERDKTSH